MTFRAQTVSDTVLEEITAKMETYSANSVTNARDPAIEARTYCKRETGDQTVEEQRMVMDTDLHIDRRLRCRRRRTRRVQ